MTMRWPVLHVPTNNSNQLQEHRLQQVTGHQGEDDDDDIHLPPLASLARAETTLNDGDEQWILPSSGGSPIMWMNPDFPITTTASDFLPPAQPGPSSNAAAAAAAAAFSGHLLSSAAAATPISSQLSDRYQALLQMQQQSSVMPQTVSGRSGLLVTQQQQQPLQQQQVGALMQQPSVAGGAPGWMMDPPAGGWMAPTMGAAGEQQQQQIIQQFRLLTQGAYAPPPGALPLAMDVGAATISQGSLHEVQGIGRKRDEDTFTGSGDLSIAGSAPAYLSTSSSVPQPFTSGQLATAPVGSMLGASARTMSGSILIGGVHTSQTPQGVPVSLLRPSSQGTFSPAAARPTSPQSIGSGSMMGRTRRERFVFVLAFSSAALFQAEHSCHRFPLILLI